MVLWSLAITFSLVLAYLFHKPDNISCLYGQMAEKYITVFSCTLGLSIAVYAIILGFHPDTLNRLLTHVNNKNLSMLSVLR